MFSRHRIRGTLFAASVLLGIWALTYLPHVGRFPYHRDDWYYMLDGFNAGPQVFRIMFWIDRPARGVLFETLFQAFGMNPLAYNLSSVLWRLMSGFAALWLFRLLWPDRPRAAMWGALLYLVYPGYLRMGAGVESQPHLISALLQVVSIALTVQALGTRNRAFKLGLWAASVVSGWGYLMLVDYAFGMEAFRLICVYLVLRRQRTDHPHRTRWLETLRRWSPSAVIPIGYLIWRLLLFQSVRPETDVGLQVGRLLQAPVLTGQQWLISWLESTLNAGFLAWGAPLYRTFFAQGLEVVRAGLLLAAVVIGLLVLGELALRRNRLGAAAGSPSADENANAWATNTTLAGMAGLILGVVPVIVANRRVTFEAYSHYALPASLAVAAMITGLLHLLSSRNARSIVLSVLVAIGMLTQFTVSSIASLEASTIREFWWQVVWRAPDFQRRTTLLVNYGSFSYVEDTSTVWGPANLIYSPRSSESIPVEYQISALALLPDRIRKVLAEAETERYSYRTHLMYERFRNVLVMSRPDQDACVHVIDGRWPRLSTRERMEIALLAPHSKIDNLLTQGQPVEPPSQVFGDEPPHGWCYVYQKAELALQSEDWEQVARLGEQAAQRGLVPHDPVEWMPFLQAYAYLGEDARLREIAAEITKEPFLRAQACATFRSMREFGHRLGEPTDAMVAELFCD